MNISFATTTNRAKQLDIPDPLITGVKTVSRRNWGESIHSRIVAQYDNGVFRHQIVSSGSFAPGTEKLGIMLLTIRPYREKLSDMPDDDVYREGNPWKDKAEFIEMLKLKPTTIVTVLRFLFVPSPLYPSGVLELAPPLNDGAFTGEKK